MSQRHPYQTIVGYLRPNIPEQALHVLLERLTREWVSDRNLKSDASPRHRAFLVAYHKGFQVKNRLISTTSSGKALCLLKTQFAKKPKNPV